MVEEQVLTLGQAFWREGFEALGNPKAILVFAAFFPKFVVSEVYAQCNVDRFRPRDAVAPRTFLGYPSQISVAFGLFFTRASKASWLVKKTTFSICHVPLSHRH